MSIFKKYFFVGIGLLIAANTWGQAARSPFTTFGIGERYGTALANTQGMAGIGVSQPQYWYANNQNPALLVYNNLTVFHAGIIGEKRTISTDTESEKSQGGNLNYLLTAFPVKPTRWTTSIGLMPYTNVNYNLQYTDVIIGTNESIDVTEKGSGGITQLAWSNGIRINKEMAVGLKASYLFSSIKNEFINQLSGANYQVKVEEKSYVQDFMLGLGFSFSRDSLFSQKKYRFSFGATYDLPADLKTKRRDIIYRSTALGDQIDADTLQTKRGQISVPGGLTIGFSLSRGLRWSVGTEFTYQDWSSFRGLSRDDEGLDKSWRVALGGEITPDQLSANNYLKRLTYRAGVSIEQYPYLANNNNVNDIGINVGLSLPTGRSSLDLAFKYGKRGSKQENVIEETYFKIYFGLTLNDQWFIKRRFD